MRQPLFYQTCVTPVTAIRVYVHVHANSKKQGFAGLTGTLNPEQAVPGCTQQLRLKIKLNAPAVDGKANQALIAFLAAAWGVPKRHIQIIQGGLTPYKTLLLQATDACHLQALLQQLQQLQALQTLQTSQQPMDDMLTKLI